MIKSITQDPSYTKISASLRKGRLYVKATRNKVVIFLKALLKADADLIRKEIIYDPESQHKTFVFVGPVEEWKEDVALLATLVTGDETGALEEFRSAIELGIRNDRTVDWIARVNGPPGLPNDPPGVDGNDEIFDFVLPLEDSET